jgi:TonB family protein
MRRRLLALSALPLFSVMLFLAARTTQTRAQDVLQSFYVVRFFFSDDVAWWNHTILDVTPVGDDVRVRLIRLALAHPPACSAMLARAVERVFPRTSVSNVAGNDICAHSEQRVVSALAAAQKNGTLTEANRQVVVATCGTEERVFRSPYNVFVDWKALERRNASVFRLFDMFQRVKNRAFGSFWFSEALVPEPELETIGATLVPEVISGKYDAAFKGFECFDQPDKKCVPNYLGWLLKNYKIPANDRGPKIELLERTSLQLTKYVPPVYPPIAESARVAGDVRLRITRDRGTGSVTTVEVVDGSPLLKDAAVGAARSWQFAPEFLADVPVDVTVRFSLNC